MHRAKQFKPFMNSLKNPATFCLYCTQTAFEPCKILADLAGTFESTVNQLPLLAVCVTYLFISISLCDFQHHSWFHVILNASSVMAVLINSSESFKTHNHTWLILHFYFGWFFHIWNVWNSSLHQLAIHSHREGTSASDRLLWKSSTGTYIFWHITLHHEITWIYSSNNTNNIQQYCILIIQVKIKTSTFYLIIKAMP